MNKSYFFLFTIAVLAFYSCQKKTTTISSATKKNKLEVSDFNFEYLVGKAKVNYLEENERQNVKANFRIKKDSIIWIQFSGVGGIEGGRCLITKDSLVIMDRINKEYQYFNYDDLSRRFKFGIDYKLIESMLIGDMPFMLQKKDKISKQDDYFLVTQRSDINLIENYIGRNTQKLEKLKVEQQTTRSSLNLKYDNFKAVGTMLFPYSGTVSLKYNSGNRSLFTEVVLEFSKVEIPEKPLKFPFNIPLKYERK